MRLLRWTALAVAIAAAVGPAAARAQRADNPHGALTDACASCHEPGGWRPARISRQFRHAEKTFPLDGAHLRTGCTTCHKTLEFATAPAGCASCHGDVHSGGLGTACQRCHTTRSFVDLAKMRRTHETTRFPLRGAHASAPCESCHVPAQPGQLQYTGRPTTCVACHVDNYRATRTPDHQASQFSQDCTSCHGVATWAGGRFDHSTTKFPLDGGHRAVACSGCHADKVYVGKPTACSSCHMTDYAASVTPPHASSGFPTACASCHTTATWKGAKFDHSATAFPLTGVHVTTLCSGCHGDGVWKGKSTACATCHQPEYSRTATPPHAASGFSITCASCHNTTAWKGAVFDHSATPFPLTGAHLAVMCASCHGDGVYQGKPTTCVSCHQANYNTALVPPHAASGFSTVCTACHNTTAWMGTTFDHSTTLFPLTGAHRAAVCAACHGDGVYKGKSTVCLSCHQQEFTTALLPPHAALGFSAVCSACHTTTAWQPASFDHSTTQFPLTGAHRAASCADCHADKVYQGKSTACASCHQATYNATTTPSHTAAGFPNTCATCHNTTSWAGATFDHSATHFPLTGVHATQPCSACHGDGVFAAKPTVCSGCHLTNYNATTNPIHSAVHFPTTCESCHNTSTWLGATFDHDGSFFPIYSGTHQGRWTVCADCHTSPANYAVFTCTSCHTAAATTPHHSGVKGYTYSSIACYSCHPKGRAG
ncbi:MAG: hypothetical protein ACHQQ3_01575 [Gemmatimonadales bacterium]